jgi:hypothetical protein
MKVFDRRKRWHFHRGVLEIFIFSQRRIRPFPLGVLELWDLSKRRRRPKLLVSLELLVSSRRRGGLHTLLPWSTWSRAGEGDLHYLLP